MFKKYKNVTFHEAFHGAEAIEKVKQQ